MKKMILTLALLFMLSFAGAITITSYTFDKASYSPGDSGELTLSITLDHSLDSGETLSGFRNVLVEVSSPFASQKSFYLGDSTETTLSVSVPLKISEDTASGVYSIPIKVSGYADISSPSKSELDVSQTTAVLKVVKNPKFSISIEPSVLSERSFVVLTVCNSGGKAREVSLSLSESFLFSKGTLYFDEIGEDECVSKNASIESFTEGKSTMTFAISYKNAIGENEDSSISIPVTVDKGSTTLILSHKNNILSGKESNIILEIKNTGKDAEDLRIRPSSDLNLVGESEILLDSLAKGTSTTLQHKVYTELSPGVHSVPFVIVWKEDGKEQTETVNVPVKVIAKDGIEVYLEAEPLPLVSNEEATLSVVVANKANFDLSSISVSIESDAFDILEISNKKFIGTLQPDDFSSEQFKIKLKDYSGDANVNVSVDYKDPSGQIRKESIIIPIKIHKLEAEQNFTIYIVITLILLAAIVYYLIAHKKIFKKIKG